MAKKAYLVLENGMVFEGEQFGAPGESIGELVFTTGVVGYLETLTDPAFAGQIVLQTFPLIGNYGVIEEDLGDTCALKGYVCSEICEAPSNFRCDYTLDEYLKKQNICAITGVDTRELTRILRENGTMNAIICEKVPDDLTAVREYTVEGAVPAVSVKEKVVYPAVGEKLYSVTLIDLGTVRSVIDSLTSYGCEVTCVPYDTPAEEILASGPDGIVISGGPGSPMDMSMMTDSIRRLIGKCPVFGISLGHQLIALALGAKMSKLPYGHHGSQPVREMGGSRTYITSQNHTYVIMPNSLPEGARTSFMNVNDRSCEGLDYRGQKCMTVQFYPTRDTAFLYEHFILMMGGGKDAQR